MLETNAKITIVITTLSRMVICERMDDWEMYDTATSRRNGAYVLKTTKTHIRHEAHGRSLSLYSYSGSIGQHWAQDCNNSFLFYFILAC